MIIPTVFGPIVDRSEDAARGSILYKQEPLGLVFISDKALELLCDINIDSTKC